MAVWPLQQVLPLVFVAFFGGGPGGLGVGLLIALGGTILVAAGAAIRWYRFTWSVQAGTLVIEQGLIQRSRRVIPADRVQSVDLVRPLRHRLLGVVQVKVEAIGGDDTEGSLDALDAGTAHAIQYALLGARAPAAARQAAGDAGDTGDTSDAPEGPPAGEAPRTLARVTPGSLVVAGLTGGRVGVVAVILGGLQQVIGNRFDDAIDLVPTDIGLVTGAVLAIAAVVVIFALSIAATVITYWDFTVMRDGNELRISRGLLEQRLETVPLRRVQGLRIEENVLRRLVGLASVKADLAGRAGGDDTTTGLLLPVAPRAEAERLVADLLGTDVPVHADLRPAEPRSRRRYLFRGLAVPVVAALAAIAGWLLVDLPAWLPLLVVVVVTAVSVPAALAAWRALGWTEAAGTLVARNGVLVRRRVHVPVGRVQRMSVTATPFQRRLRLADVDIGIARSGGWEGPRIQEVDADDAMSLTARTVHAAVEASRRPAG